MKKNSKKVVSFIVYLLILILLVSTLIFVIYNKNKNKKFVNIEIENNIPEEAIKPVYYKGEIDRLRSKYHNDDVKGILEIENTSFTAPIMQSKDNNYYLNHLPDKTESFMGSIYLDYRNNIDSDRKLLIYGHNSSNVEMPFDILEEFYDKEYYDSHKYMYITTENMKKKYEIFSVHVEPSDYSYMQTDFKSDNEYFEHLKKLKSKSIYDTGVEVTKDDEVLVLQTCSTHKDYYNYSKKYLLIILRRV